MGAWNWSVTLRKEERLKIFETKVLREVYE
jgi:hypothetical protein